MSPLPVRAEVKASRLPSGEYRGRDSFAGCEMRSRASPPRAGTSQMSPPLTNAIVDPSGEMPGSPNDGNPEGADAAASPSAEKKKIIRVRRQKEIFVMRRSIMSNAHALLTNTTHSISWDTALTDIDHTLNTPSDSVETLPDRPLVREGLPQSYRMRADSHYVEQFDEAPPTQT